jgi:pyruvate formate lyase activating enzyme
LESRPIEIKPFFHYHPGSTALTFSTFGCNFRCPWCQNHHLSRAEPDPRNGNYVSPQKLVDMALEYGDSGLCVSFQEPTLLFEYCLEVFPLAKEKSLYNCFVSNGYQTESALKMLVDVGLTGLKIDIKGDRKVYQKYCQDVDVEKIWENAQNAMKLGIHVEIVSLVITNVNDDDECLEYVINNHLKYLGEEVPLHITRYHPAYKFHNPATKIEILEKAYEMAKKNGVQYPYLGNVLGHEYENTYCPDCGEMLIKRYGHRMVKNNMKEDKRCGKCGHVIPIWGHYYG